MEATLPSNPYPGLRPFRFEENYLFFGREGQSDELIELLTRKRFVAVVGTSGSGKSSLVTAGLLPDLYGGHMVSAGSNWRVATFRPGNDPIGNLARSLANPEVLGDAEEDEAGLLPTIYESTLRSSTLGLVEIVRNARLPKDENLLVIADQFEELFRYRETLRARRTSDDAAAFVKLLLTAGHEAGLPLYIILTMRSDFIGDCAQFRDLPEAINEGQYLIPRMTRDQRQRVIEGPAAVAGGEFSPRLVQRLLNEVGDNPDQLPIMQHALMRTWAYWRRDGRDEGPIDLEHYEAIGTMEDALSQHADEAYDELPDPRNRKIAEMMFKRITEKGPDNREIRRPTLLSDICAVANGSEDEVIAIIDRFRIPGRTFLMPPIDVRPTADTVIDISHESLIRVWDRLRAWVEEETESARVYHRLAETAALHADGKAELLRNPELKIILDWRKEASPNATWAERYDPNFERARKFLEESDRLERRRALIRRAAAWTGIAALVIAFFAAVGFAAVQTVEVNQSGSTQTAQATEIIAANVTQTANANQIMSSGVTQTAGAMELDRQATSAAIVQATATAASVVPDRFLRSRPLKPGGSVSGVDASSAGSLGIFVEDASGRMYSLGTLASFGLLGGIGAADDPSRIPVTSGASCPGNPAIVQPARADGGDPEADAIADVVQCLPLISGESVTGLLALAQLREDVEFQTIVPNLGVIRGVRPAVAGEQVTMFGRTSGQKTGVVSEVGASVSIAPGGGATLRLTDAIIVSPIATAGDDGALVLNEEGYAVGIVVGASSESTILAPLDRSLEAFGVELVTVGRNLAIMRGSGRALTAGAWSPDGRWVATGTVDGELFIWRAGDEDPSCLLRDAHERQISAVDFSQDSALLVTSSWDSSVRLWDVNSCRQVLAFGGYFSRVTMVMFSPTDDLFVTAGSDDDLAFIVRFDRSQRSVLESLRLNHNQVDLAVISPQGDLIVTAGQEGSLRGWDLTGTQIFESRRRSGQTVNQVSFSADGTQFVTAGAEGLTCVWNAATGEQRVCTNTQFQSAVNAAAFSPDGTLIVTASDDSMVRIWNAQTGELIRELSGHEGPVLSVMFSPDGSLIVSSGRDDSARIWDRDGNPILGLFEHRQAVTRAIFNLKGTRVLTISDDSRAIIWQAK